jgi:hypothetical protein
MAPLPVELRGLLQRAVLDARVAAEGAAREALGALAVEEDRAFDALDEQQKILRRGLRAKVRQLGGFDALVAEVAYEQWHRMLFARFLAENNLLIHSDMGVAVSLAECKELAEEVGAANEWVLAAEFAGRMLPGVFRSDDPSLAVQFAHEGRVALEQILTALPPAVFTADDSLGWVYQFWQTEAKKEVNQSERKIGGADLAPVTQLFTEHYMVRFLLENSLGAWWTGRHPDSPLLGEFEYLRRLDDGTPAAGAFEGWPATVAEVTVMDPCCGSGHFLVEAFDMLHKMRMEEEGLDARAAGDAVIRDNLFGLELDPRCTQIAAFAVAFAAWKTGGYRQLPQPNIACSGIRIEGQWPEWKKLAAGDGRLEQALWQLFELFQRAPDLGSLIDPVRELERDGGLLVAPFEEVGPLFDQALADEVDAERLVTGIVAQGTARAAQLLARSFILISTNVPYLGRGRQDDALRDYSDSRYSTGRADLAAAFLLRILGSLADGGSLAIVLPDTILHLASFAELRARILSGDAVRFVAKLGAGAFSGISGEVVKALLMCVTRSLPRPTNRFFGMDVSGEIDRSSGLRLDPLTWPEQAFQFMRPKHRIALVEGGGEQGLLSDVAKSVEGTSTGDAPRYMRFFWELAEISRRWERFQRAPVGDSGSGCQEIVLWDEGTGALASDPGARIQGLEVHGKPGVLVGRMGRISAGPYFGGFYDKSCVVLAPKVDGVLPAVLAYCTMGNYEAEVRAIDTKVGAATSVMVEVPFDLAEWSTRAEADRPRIGRQRLNPSQWLFDGRLQASTEPLQVAVGRLLGYRWPDHEGDDLDQLADGDGLVPLPAIAGELGAADRMRKVLGRAYGAEFSPALMEELLAEVGAPGKSLADWLRDGFFDHHLKVFQQRPFVWHIWDGRKDGFSVLANYHKLDRARLRKLTYTMLGSWIEMQQAAVSAGATGADLRLATAKNLQDRLALILEGEAPYDIYVRWKSPAEQPIGWDPDLDDGVRMNIRPFVQAGVLRKPPKLKWTKDRGKNPDGSERINDVHLTLAEKRKARGLPA